MSILTAIANALRAKDQLAAKHHRRIQPGRPVEVANDRHHNPVKEEALLRLPRRRERRAIARAQGTIHGWRDPRNRYLTANGQHIVLWPQGVKEA